MAAGDAGDRRTARRLLGGQDGVIIDDFTRVRRVPRSIPVKEGFVLSPGPVLIMLVAMVAIVTAPLFAPLDRQSWAADPPPGDPGPGDPRPDDDASAAGCAVHRPEDGPHKLRFSEWMARAEAGGTALARVRNLVVMTYSWEIDALRSAPALRQMERVNALVNNLVHYRPDVGAETWKEPVQTLTAGGDCEDYALLKAYSLVTLGWPRQGLQLAVGRLADGRRHAMLSVALDGKTYLLDNLAREPSEADGYPWRPLYRLPLTEP